MTRAADRARGLLDSFSASCSRRPGHGCTVISTANRPHFDIGLLIQPMLFVSLGLVAAGIGLGWSCCIARPGRPIRSRKRSPRCFVSSKTKCGSTNSTQSRSSRWRVLRRALSDWMDRYFWDGLVRAVGGIGQLFGMLTKGFDERGINAGVDEATHRHARSRPGDVGLHSGQIQTYLGAIAVGMLALLFFTHG